MSLDHQSVLFSDVDRDWHLEGLCRDLAKIKEHRSRRAGGRRAIDPRQSQLSAMEQLHLRGFLAGLSTAELAKALGVSVNGLRAELTPRLYSYLKELTGDRQRFCKKRVIATLVERGYRRSTTDRAASAVICWLPARDSARFEGRDRDQKQLNHWLEGEGGDRCLVIEGAGGTGKTALALESADRLVSHSTCPFGAVIFVSAQTTQLTGMGILPKLQSDPTFEGLLGMIADRLQRPMPDHCQDERSRWQWVWQQLARQRTLLIVDGFEALSDPVTTMAFLCDLPATVKVLITSRQRLFFERSIHLSGLDSSAALAWITDRAEDAGWPWSLADYKALVDITGGLPGAIAWVLGQLAAGQPLPWAIAQLQRPDCVVAQFYCHRALAALQAHWTTLPDGGALFGIPAGPPTATASVTAAEAALETTSTIAAATDAVPHLVSHPAVNAAAHRGEPTNLGGLPSDGMLDTGDRQPQWLANQLLAILSWFARPVAASTLAAIAGQEPDTPAISDALSAIAQQSIVEVNAAGHYGLPPFMRHYVATQIAPEWPEAAALAARERWVQWAIDYVQQHGHGDRLEWPADTTALDAQWPTLQDVLDWCLAQGWLDRFWDLFCPLRGYTHFRGHWRDRVARNTKGLAIARERGDRALEAQLLFDRAWTQSLKTDHQSLTRAARDYQAAWELRDWIDLDLQISLAINQFRLAISLKDAASRQQWHEHLANLVHDPRLGEDRATRLECQWLYYQADDLAEQPREQLRALKYYQHALELARRIEWQRGMAYIQSSIGALRVAQQQFYSACRDLEACRNLAESILDLRCLAYCKKHLARAKQGLGHPQDARQIAQGAIALFESLQMDSEVAQLQKLILTLR